MNKEQISVGSEMGKTFVILKYILRKKLGKHMKLMTVFRKSNGQLFLVKTYG